MTVGTVMERTRVPLHKWALAFHMMASSKKGVSAHYLHRSLGVTYKTAWFMAHRIREAMMPEPDPPFGGGGTPVEVDETFIGQEPGAKRAKAGYGHKMKVLTIIDRATGQARSSVINSVSINEIAPIMDAAISRQAVLMTDESKVYAGIGWNFAEHHITTHRAQEYVSPRNNLIHTNTVEGFYSIFKRGMKGVYQHCGRQHLHRYTAEYDFRYSNRNRLGVSDDSRARRAIAGAWGRRLTYRRLVRRASPTPD